ncbi:di-heme oxidoredictase family protein [Labrys wisconsinensis]|uniref:CxxC motif-containing protein (DUF1111 family) n=1 Tax=Labrys wisconsinensis TaxID=425677 RepID=A0ABU0JAG5_9HYPH|nr:di-heme oxidoredictase family protein [Labrys wisconsinensis]MDQ0471261.1 CxxC motif-containing protein (DUF1111 family) [Labrys wisconsinensis]
MDLVSLTAVFVLLAAPALADSLDVAIGQKLFKRQWVSAPSSTKSNDGLGPLYAAPSCASCHPGGGGGVTPVVRFGLGEGGDPVYGRQLQPFAVTGLDGEGTARIIGTDGRPSVTIEGLAYGPLDPATRIGLRRPPGLGGLGAVAALGDDAILANAGTLGGRPNRRPDGRIGRFGWKAADADIEEQVAAAFSLDMGLSTRLRPDPYGDCTPAQGACRAAPTGSDHGEPEIADPILAAISAYVASLTAPSPDPAAPGGAAFERLGCAACHRPMLSDISGRTAAVFSDLLLHEMGPDLDDGVAEPGVASSEWRTAPLIGLGARLAAGGALLHDGRATTIAGAVAAHGGQAGATRAAFDRASPEERAALESYLKGL